MLVKPYKDVFLNGFCIVCYYFSAGHLLCPAMHRFCNSYDKQLPVCVSQPTKEEDCADIVVVLPKKHDDSAARNNSGLSDRDGGMERTNSKLSPWSTPCQSECGEGFIEVPDDGVSDTGTFVVRYKM